ncbi:hypothetical protein LQ948_00065 [Jiella sp. MQZ9-1]|uniref:Uncharacterized protein n=1 Tax=Jiella flava TaxID=2816857 RepID=A0A939FS85_9HYPH|nr:hypothetical protein [Jiella flava]MBO0660953.1 hypothetical protein [Jiella flava]MCD2469601.1 hypothetical protein [Jiella flava]
MSRERALADGIKEVAAELRLVDVVDYVAFLRLEHYGNLADIVSSSSELYLKPGVLRFADGGEVRLKWGEVPVIILALEFRHAGVTAHLHLELGATTAAVDIVHVSYDERPVSQDEELVLLKNAIADAHLKPAA